MGGFFEGKGPIALVKEIDIISILLKKSLFITKIKARGGVKRPGIST